MADIYSTVQFTIQLLLPLIKDEVSLMYGLQDQVKDICNELNSMLALLRDMDKRAEEDDESVKEWIKQVRTLADDIEDVVEAYKHYQKENAFGKVMQHMSLKVRNIASTIESLRERAKELGRRKDIYSSYSYIRSSSSSSSSSVTLQEHNCIRIQGAYQHTSTPVCITQEYELVGVETAKLDLIGLLGLQDFEDSRISPMIAVIGMRGLGKTTVVGSVYNDATVKDYFPIRAWVHVSRPYNHVDVLKSMIKQFYEATKEINVLHKISACRINHCNDDGRPDKNADAYTTLNRTDSTDVVSLQNLVRSYLKEKRYMVVIDDIQDHDMKLANYIKSVLPIDNNKGSKILMTTRYENVARTWLDGSNHGLYKLKPLTEEKALELFCKKAFQSHRGECPSSLQDLTRDIVKRCEGLPLIILEMGRFLSMRSDDPYEWKKVHQCLGFYLQQDYLTGVHNILIRSYHSLPSRLKPCFLYFGLFPKGRPVDRMQLIRLWIAEGFIGESSNLTLEEVAEEYINQLIGMNIVEVERTDATGKPKTLRVHEYLHEIILSKVKEFNFCHTLPDKNSNIIDLNVEPRRLSINIDHSFNNAVANPAKEIVIRSKSNTRSILLITDSTAPVKLWPKVLTKALNNNRQLKVLDLCNAPIDELPKEVGKLLNLQYLSLRNTRVKRMPSSIGKLQDLQTLDLKQTPIHELPAEINELHKLSHLLTYCYEHDPAFSLHTMKTIGLKLPKGVLENFGELQKLAFVDVEHNSTVIKELRNLRQLRKLGIVVLKLEDGKDLCAAIEKMECLQAFSVYSKNMTEWMDLEHFQSPPSTLKRLYLNGPLMPPFPSWILELHCLVKIRLRWSCLDDVDPLECLETLPSLVELQLLDAYCGDTLKIGAAGFKKLKILHLLDLQALKTLTIYKGALPLLQHMAIGVSPRLEVPLGIKYLPRLETLTFFDTPWEFDRSLLQDGQYHSVVKHVPDVRFLKSGQRFWHT
ncbi:disease resistance protein RPM1-like [Chenopodium quinoa]|uniref:disease resistance protein RPM1-like n=1 Tax=Chenopodium quinoa TaxID=63459 RepID=UPI000B776F54|nr:disease resistance protein RPM1-like [Chenopodium quinoa]XP_021745065.1 disease resistance protein RPM1-like [Chenopodium quinoa]